MWRLKVISLSIFIVAAQPFVTYYGPPKEATLKERPFQVAIIKNEVYWCGATIISDNCALTSCSCIVDNMTDLDRMNELHDNYTLVSYTKYIVAQQINWEPATDLFIAEGCNPRNNENDLAILCGKDRIIGYPTAVVKERTKENVRAIVSGWGLSVTGKQPIQDELQRAYMRIISLKECRQRYAGVREVPDSALCAVATDEVRGFCAGDLGGPLTHGEGIIGISVAKFGCEDRKYPGIFTNVSMFSNFIDHVVSNHKIHPDLLE